MLIIQYLICTIRQVMHPENDLMIFHVFCLLVLRNLKPMSIKSFHEHTTHNCYLLMIFHKLVFRFLVFIQSQTKVNQNVFTNTLLYLLMLSHKHAVRFLIVHSLQSILPFYVLDFAISNQCQSKSIHEHTLPQLLSIDDIPYKIDL